MYIELYDKQFKVRLSYENKVEESKEADCNMIICPNVECDECTFDDEKIHKVDLV